MRRAAALPDKGHTAEQLVNVLHRSRQNEQAFSFRRILLHQSEPVKVEEDSVPGAMARSRPFRFYAGSRLVSVSMIDIEIDFAGPSCALWQIGRIEGWVRVPSAKLKKSWVDDG